MKALSDRARGARPTVPTSVSLAAWRDKDVIPALVTAGADVATLTGRRTTLLESPVSSNAAIDHAEAQLTIANREVTRLTLLRDAADAEIPRLIAAEASAAERLRSEKALVDAETLAFREDARKNLDSAFAEVARLATRWRTLTAHRSAWYRLHQVSPDLARAEVPVALVSDAVFAPHQGAANIEQCILVLPAFADPAGGTPPRARHWPPVPPATPGAPARGEGTAPRNRNLTSAAVLTVIQPRRADAPAGRLGQSRTAHKGLHPDSTWSDAASRALA